MSIRQFWVLATAVTAITIAVVIAALRVQQLGPHSTSVQLTRGAGQRAQLGLNLPMPNVTLVDLNGRRHNLRDARGQVVVFLVQGDRCPCSKAYVPRVNALYDDYAPKGVEIWAFDPNANETEAETRAYVKANGCRYPVAYDRDHVVADMLDAACTTEVWVADRDGILRYHGRIDDNIYEPKKVKRRDLRIALDAVLADGLPPTPETRAYACTISREATPEDQAAAVQ